MRSTQTCPKCTGRRFAVSTPFRFPDVDAGNLAPQLPAVTTPSRSGGIFAERKELGSFETWICLQCGYTEFYAKGIEGIEQLAKEEPEHLRIVDGTSGKQGPFR